MQPLADADIPKVVALGRQVAETGQPPAQPARAAARAAWEDALERAKQKTEA